MIAIIDYGLGNINAFANVYKRLNISAYIVKHAEELETASKIILPGVGAFDHAITKLNSSGMRERLDKIVLKNKIPVLGICVGMQMLAFTSEEGRLPGLGWIGGHVQKITRCSQNRSIRVPHMGWNNVKSTSGNPLFKGLEKEARFYFLHSYCFCPNKDDDIVAVSDYAGVFACAVNSGNIYGVQFHPEKSHKWGVQLLENFARL